MKTKVIILTAIVALFSFTVASTMTKSHKVAAKKNITTEQANKGLAMEDRDQFN